MSAEAVLDRRVEDLAEVGREHRVLGAAARESPRRRRSQAHLPVCGVVKQRSSSAPRSASAAWSSIDEVLRRELGVGDRRSSRCPPRRAASTTREDLVARRWPVASTRPWRATACEHARVSGSSAPSASTTVTGSMSHAPPRAARCCSAHPDRDLGARRELRLLAALVDASRRSAARPCARPRARRSRPRAGSCPPTARLSVIAPSTSTPGTAARRPRRAPPSRCSATSAGSPPSPSSAKRRASVRSSISRSTTSGAMCTCVSKAPRSSARARSADGVGIVSRLRTPLSSSASTARAAAVTRGWTPSSRSSSPASSSSSHAARRVRALPSSRRSSERGVGLGERRARSSARNQSSQPAARAARIALEQGRGEALHEDGARAACARRRRPGSSPRTSTGMPSGRRHAPRSASAPEPGGQRAACAGRGRAPAPSARRRRRARRRLDAPPRRA